MTATAPTIIPRAAWGANPLRTPATGIALPTAELWLHHSAGEQFGAAGMRMLQAFTLHRPDAHYLDLEYTFVVDHADCTIYESRGPGRDSAATGGHNSVSHAICVMGNFENDPVSPQLIETLANLAAYGYEQGWWRPCGFTGGHRDASGNSTACPGAHLEAVIPQINARAVAIHQAGQVKEPPVVSPQYAPFNINGVVGKAKCPTGGEWLLTNEGAVFAFDCPYFGGVENHLVSAQGKPRVPARIDVRRYGFLNHKIGYRVTFDDGSAHNLPEGS